MLKSFFGTKKFYRSLIAITIPIMIQQGLTSIVSVLDNVMVGQLSENAIAGVAIANQILFVCFAALMGGLSGPSIFVSQYHGAKDHAKLQQSFRTKAIFAFGIVVVFFILYLAFGNFFIHQYLKDELSIIESSKYFKIIIFSIIPLGFVQLYGSSFREIGQPKIAMYCGLVTIFLNAGLNYILIFGHLGLPALGVQGAAIATVVARSIEAVLLVSVAHLGKFSFATHVYRHFHIAKTLLVRIVKKGLPLLGNEIAWSGGMSVLILMYAMRGNQAIAAFTISSTVSNLFYTVFAGLATGIAVFVGSELGANRLDEASSNARKILVFGCLVGMGAGLVLFITAAYVPLLYNVDESVRHTATSLMRVVSVLIPIFAVNVGCFFILRAGGSSLVTFLFDSGSMWLFAVPLAFVLARYTHVSIVYMYLFVQSLDFIKMFFGIYLVSKKRWVRNLTLEPDM